MVPTYEEQKKKRFPRICRMGNPKAAGEMIVALAAGYLAGGGHDNIDEAIKKAADAVEVMLRDVTGDDFEPVKFGDVDRTGDIETGLPPTDEDA